MASRGVNKVILVGRLGNDPDVRVTPGNFTITTLSVATSETWKDKNTGQMQERTEWHRVKVMGKVGEIAGQYLKKGSQAYFEGKLQTDKWQDKDGQDRYSTSVVVDSFGGSMQFLDAKTGGDVPYQQNQAPMQNENPAPQNYNQTQQAAAPQQMQSAPPQQQAPAGLNDMDDDIPF
jgi:single-strand DNA-binding protein